MYLSKYYNKEKNYAKYITKEQYNYHLNFIADYIFTLQKSYKKFYFEDFYFELGTSVNWDYENNILNYEILLNKNGIVTKSNPIYMIYNDDYQTVFNDLIKNNSVVDDDLIWDYIIVYVNDAKKEIYDQVDYYLLNANLNDINFLK